MNENKSMGAIVNDPDVRDISIFDLTMAAGAPKMKNITDISMLPVNDQKRLGTCVPEALTKYMQYREWKRSGKILDFSVRIPYRLGRELGGITSPFNQGSRSRDVLKSMSAMGLPLTDVLEENKDLEHSAYLDFEINDKMAESGSPHTVEGFAFVPISVNALTLAIDNFELVALVVAVGAWNRMPVKPPRHDDDEFGTHEILVYGYERVKNDLKLYFRNSWDDDWGNKGNGEFMLSEFTKDPSWIRDAAVITDIPADVLKEVRGRSKKPVAKFDTEVKYGDRGQKVTDLQLCLRYEGLYGLDAKIDGSYGPKTAKAVIGLQERYATATIQAIQIGEGRRIGIKERELLNELYRAPVNTSIYSANIIAWAKAIQEKEGFIRPGVAGFPRGSRSWRNNNPGNIRYTGLFINLAKGKDDKNFCVFETYEAGLNALCLLLKRAATGLSTIYRPEHSLLRFYEIYAPKSDGNDPVAYAKYVADRIGVDVETPIKKLL